MYLFQDHTISEHSYCHELHSAKTTSSPNIPCVTRKLILPKEHYCIISEHPLCYKLCSAGLTLFSIVAIKAPHTLSVPLLLRVPRFTLSLFGSCILNKGILAVLHQLSQPSSSPVLPLPLAVIRTPHQLHFSAYTILALLHAHTLSNSPQSSSNIACN